MSNLPTALQGVLDDIERDSGRNFFVGDLPEIEVIPFTSPQLNFLTRGGIPYGASTEIVGEEHSGKSTLAQDLIKNFQKIEAERYKKRKAELEELIPKTTRKKEKKDLEDELANLTERRAVYLDIERTLNPQWLAKLGVDEEKVIIYKPTDVGMEKPLENIITLMETGQVGMVVIDSVGQMISTAESDKNIGDGHYGGIAKPLTQYYRKAGPAYAMHNVAHVVVNQTREDLSGYNQLVRPGGKAHKFAQSVTIRLRPGDSYNDNYQKGVKADAFVYARETVVQMVKNKVRGADRQTTSFTIRPNYGIDVAYDTFEQAQEEHIIVKSGAWYKVFDFETGEELANLQGAANAMAFLEENEEYLEKLQAHLYELACKD